MSRSPNWAVRTVLASVGVAVCVDVRVGPELADPVPGVAVGAAHAGVAAGGAPVASGITAAIGIAGSIRVELGEGDCSEHAINSNIAPKKAPLVKDR